MERSGQTLLWAGIALVLIALAVPWPLWGSQEVIAGLPIWVWWHVAWLVLTSLAFWVFTKVAWGTGVEEVSQRG
jgi:hypothetical protein